jgi:hypothetical protein
MLELVSFREKGTKRETRVREMLHEDKTFRVLMSLAFFISCHGPWPTCKCMRFRHDISCCWVNQSRTQVLCWNLQCKLVGMTRRYFYLLKMQVIGMLGFIKDNIWKSMFGKPADSLERAIGQEDECKTPM